MSVEDVHSFLPWSKSDATQLLFEVNQRWKWGFYSKEYILSRIPHLSLIQLHPGIGRMRVQGRLHPGEQRHQRPVHPRGPMHTVQQQAQRSLESVGSLLPGVVPEPHQHLHQGSNPKAETRVRFGASTL
jgi:hypothetical protein